MFSGCKSHHDNGGSVEFNFNGKEIKWGGNRVMITWMPGMFAWHFWVDSFGSAPLDWRADPEDHVRSISAVWMDFLGSPKEIATFDDLVGKSFTCTGFSLAVPGHFSQPSALLTSWLVSRVPEHADRFQITIDRVDSGKQRVIGHFEGKAFLKMPGQPESAGTSVDGIKGSFDLPLYPVKPDQQLSWTAQEASRLNSAYDPNHYSSLDTIQRAADAHDLDAEAQVAMMYHMGEGLPQDEKKAGEGWEKAAEDGSSLAMTFLASCPAIDSAHRYFWATLAIKNGHARSSYSRDNAARLLTHDQISETDKEIEKWQKAHPQSQRKRDKVPSVD